MSSSTSDAKTRLREQMRAARRALTPEQRQVEAEAVWARALAAVEEGPVFVFLGVRSELPTRGLLERLRERFEVAIPRITGKGEMEAAGWTLPLVPGAHGIPTSDGPVLDVRTALLPGLAFDREGGRLGYGGAYYDRWLTAHPDVQAIGLGFACQLVDRVPREPHDRCLERVICGPSPLVDLPAGLEPYRQTSTFDTDTLPRGLRADHTTKPGVWGRIVVEEGSVLYTIGDTTTRLVPGRPGVVPPTVPHHLTVEGAVRLHIEFLRASPGE